jgi:hypothetical protein
MVQAMSLFNQLLQHFPSLEFAGLVKKHSADEASLLHWRLAFLPCRPRKHI